MRLPQRLAAWRGRWQAVRLARQIARHARPDSGRKPVVFFNATARLGGLSQNAAFALLTAWGLRLSGLPVVHFVCQAGMSPCVLGTDRQDHHNPPPCKACIRQSHRLYTRADMHWFQFTSTPPWPP